MRRQADLDEFVRARDAFVATLRAEAERLVAPVLMRLDRFLTRRSRSSS